MAGKVHLTKETWRVLLVRTDGPALIRLAIHVGIVLFLALLISLRPPYWPALILLQGVVLIFLFAPLHECIHDTAFKSTWCNRLVAIVCGWLLLLPPAWFRYYHLNHHRFTNDPSRDPELTTLKPLNRRDHLIYMTGLTTWWRQLLVLLRNAFGRNRDEFIPRKAHRRITVEAALFIAAYGIAYQILGDAVYLMWVVPALVGQPFLRAFLLSEHLNCPDARDMTINSRTTVTNLLVRWLTWNMSFHAEHHYQPAVPFHKLPLFHQYLRPQLQVIHEGYFDLNRDHWSRLT